MEADGHTHSSATTERFQVPSLCTYCGLRDGVTIDEIDGRVAKLKCTYCKHVWRIDPTPLWQILDKQTREYSELRKAVNEFISAVNVNQACKVPPLEWTAMRIAVEKASG